MRFSLLIVVVSVHAVSLGGGEREMVPTDYSLKAAYEKITKLVPSVPRRWMLLKEQEVYFHYLMDDLEAIFNALPSKDEDISDLRSFCGGNDDYLEKCATILAKLMKEVRDDCRQKALYRGYSGACHYKVFRFSTEEER